MIELVNVSKYYLTDFGKHYIFRDVSLRLPLDKSVGVLGPNGAGKSTFLRLLGGADIPSSGSIIRTGKISPPMGLTPGLQASLTAVENARFAGRIYGLTRDEIADMIDYVRELANIGKFFDMPVATYSAGMRQRVSFSINMSLDFDYYLFDEVSAGGDREFRKISKAMVEDRLERANFIIASHRVDELLDLCDSGIVIQNGELKYFDDIADAVAYYGVEDDEEASGEDGAKGRRARKRAEKEAAEKEAAAAGLSPEEARRERRRRRKDGEDGAPADNAENAAELPAPAFPEMAAAEAAAVDDVQSVMETPAAPAVSEAPPSEETVPAESPPEAADTPAGMPAGEIAAEPASPEDEDARRRRRKERKRRGRDGDAAAPDAPAEAAASDAEQAIADPSAGVPRLGRRAQKRAQKRAEDTSPPADAATDAPAEIHDGLPEAPQGRAASGT